MGPYCAVCRLLSPSHPQLCRLFYFQTHVVPFISTLHLFNSATILRCSLLSTRSCVKLSTLAWSSALWHGRTWSTARDIESSPSRHGHTLGRPHAGRRSMVVQRHVRGDGDARQPDTCVQPTAPLHGCRRTDPPWECVNVGTESDAGGVGNSVQRSLHVISRDN